MNLIQILYDLKNVTIALSSMNFIEKILAILIFIYFVLIICIIVSHCINEVYWFNLRRSRKALNNFTNQ